MKSLSAMTLMASPSCACIRGGVEIIRPTSSFLIAATSSAGSRWFPSSSVQERRTRFLKQRALASRVVSGYVSEAVIWSRSVEKPGCFSRSLSAVSAVGDGACQREAESIS